MGSVIIHTSYTVFHNGSKKATVIVIIEICMFLIMKGFYCKIIHEPEIKNSEFKKKKIPLAKLFL